MAIVEAFQNCGASAYLVLLLSMVALLIGLVALALVFSGSRAAKIVAGLALAGALTAMGAGLLGAALGRKTVDEVLQSGAIDPEQHDRIRAVGYAEAAQCSDLGLGMGAVPLLLGGVALVVAFTRKSE